MVKHITFYQYSFMAHILLLLPVFLPCHSEACAWNTLLVVPAVYFFIVGILLLRKHKEGNILAIKGSLLMFILTVPNIITIEWFNFHELIPNLIVLSTVLFYGIAVFCFIKVSLKNRRAN